MSKAKLKVTDNLWIEEEAEQEDELFKKIDRVK